MRKVYLIAFALIFCLVSLAPFKTASARKASRYHSAKGEVIVKLKASDLSGNALPSSFNQDALMALAREAGERTGAFREIPGSEAIEPLVAFPMNSEMKATISRYGFDRTV